MEPRNIGELAIDYLIWIILNDLGKFIDNKPSSNGGVKDIIDEWIYAFEDHQDSISEQEMTFIQTVVEELMDGMPIWGTNKDFHNKILIAFENYFNKETAFYEIIKSAYLKGLEKEEL